LVSIFSDFRRSGPPVTGWSPDAGSRDRFLFHIRDRDRYPAAMTAALKGLLLTLA